MTRYPEAVEVIRSVEPVQPARGGRVTRVTVRLDNGRAVSFYEVESGGMVLSCHDRAEAFAAAREKMKGLVNPMSDAYNLRDLEKRLLIALLNYPWGEMTAEEMQDEDPSFCSRAEVSNVFRGLERKGLVKRVPGSSPIRWFLPGEEPYVLEGRQLTDDEEDQVRRKVASWVGQTIHDGANAVLVQHLAVVSGLWSHGRPEPTSASVGIIVSSTSYPVDLKLSKFSVLLTRNQAEELRDALTTAIEASHEISP